MGRCQITNESEYCWFFTGKDIVSDELLLCEISITDENEKFMDTCKKAESPLWTNIAFLIPFTFIFCCAGMADVAISNLPDALEVDSSS